MALALTKTKGVVTHAAQLAGVSRRSHSRWLKEDPAYAEAVELGRRERVDMALAVVLERVAKGEQDALKAAMYVLDNEGQCIGYGLKPQTAVQVNTQVNAGKEPSVPLSALREFLKGDDKDEDGNKE